MAMSCPHCNAPTTETQRFCRYCGYRLDHGVQDLVATETFEKGASYTPGPRVSESPPWMPPAPMPVDTTRMHRRGRGKKLFFIIGGVVLSASLIAGGIYSFISDRFIWERPASGVFLQNSYMGVDFSDEGKGGAFIRRVINGHPADLAGLIGGDLIIEANGRPVRSAGEMRRVLGSIPPGTELHLLVLRDGQQVELVIVTGGRGDFAESGSGRPVGFFGYDPDDVTRVLIPESKIFGARVNDLVSNGPAEIAGIREGDIVIEFNGHPIRTSSELRRRIAQTEPYATVDVKVVRGGEEMVIPVKLGRND